MGYTYMDNTLRIRYGDEKQGFIVTGNLHNIAQKQAYIQRRAKREGLTECTGMYYSFYSAQR